MTIIEIRGWVELVLIIFVAAKSFGSMIQKQESGGAQQSRDLTNLRELVELTFKNINDKLDRASGEMSKWASYMQGVEARTREDYVSNRTCDDRMVHAAENLKNCQERHFQMFGKE